MSKSVESTKASMLMKRMVIVAALIIIAAGAVYYRSLAVLPFTLGVIITSCLNILKVRMLEKTVYKVVGMDDQEAGKNVVRFRYLLRYFLTGIVLVAVGLIHTYTTPPPFYTDRDSYLGVWAMLFPNAPETLLNAPLISMWGALAGIFTLQLSIIIVRSLKLEKDGTEFIEYVDDDDKEVGDIKEDIKSDENVNNDEQSEETHG